MTALTRLMKLAIPHMQQTDGRTRILNVASVAAFISGPGMAVYHATKSYLSLTEAVARELQGAHVSVTALCPGATESHFFDAAEMQDVPVTKMGKLPGAANVARAGWDGAMAGRTVVVPGGMNRILAMAPRLLPGGHSGQDHRPSDDAPGQIATRTGLPPWGV